MPFTLSLMIYLIAVVLGIALRMILKIFMIDAQTGFYEVNSPLAIVFSILLALAVIAIFLTSFGRKKRGIAPTMNSPILSFVLTMTGISLGAYSVLSICQTVISVASGGSIPVVDCVYDLVTLIAAICVLYLARKISSPYQESINPVAAVFPLLWQLFLLINKYILYVNHVHISDQFLEIYFMVTNCVFLIAQARLITGVPAKRTASIAAAFGLISSLLGCILVFSHVLYMLLGDPLGYALLDGNLFNVALMSIYNLIFVLILNRRALPKKEIDLPGLQDEK